MRIKLFLVMILAVATLLFPGGMALASDISNALFKAVIRVTNDGDIATNVSANLSLNTTALVEDGFADSASDFAMQVSGTDVAFMPGYGSNPWVLWVETISSGQNIDYDLYMGNVTGGKICYFPGSGGMTTADNSTLELGDNFTIEQRGWVDTTYSTNKRLAYKPGAFTEYVSASENITALFGSESPFYSSTSDGELYKGDAVYATAHNAAVGIVTDDQNFENVGQWLNAGTYHIYRPGFYVDTSDVPDTATILSATLMLYGKDEGGSGDFAVTIINGTDLDDPMVVADYGDLLDDTVSWGSSNATTWTNIGYNSIELNATGLSGINKTGITKLALRSSNDISSTAPTGIEFVSFYMTEAGGIASDPRLVITYSFGIVTASDTTSGNHTVTVTANVTHLTIAIDGDVKDTAALTANVTNNSENWTFLQNGVMPYMEYHKVMINGTLQQHIEWEYDSVFHDQSAYENNATPTFRTTSSDADVSATLVSFQPVQQAKVSTFTLVQESQILTGNLTAASQMYSEANFSKIIGADAVNVLLDEGEIPRALWWFPFLFISISIIGMVTYGATRLGGANGSLLTMCIVIEVLLALFGIMNPIPLWPAILFPIPAIALIVSQKHQAWG